MMIMDDEFVSCSCLVISNLFFSKFSISIMLFVIFSFKMFVNQLLNEINMK